MENKGLCEIWFPSYYITVSPQVNEKGELCKQMKKKSTAWNPITNDLCGGLACTARFKYKSVKIHRTVFLGKCGVRNLEKTLVAYKYRRRGGAKPRKFKQDILGHLTN